MRHEGATLSGTSDGNRLEVANVRGDVELSPSVTCLPKLLHGFSPAVWKTVNILDVHLR